MRLSLVHAALHLAPNTTHTTTAATTAQIPQRSLPIPLLPHIHIHTAQKKKKTCRNNTTRLLTRRSRSHRATVPRPASPHTALHPHSHPRSRLRTSPTLLPQHATPNPRTSRHGTRALTASKTSASSSNATRSQTRRRTT